MIRIIFLVFRFLFRLPFIFHKVKHYRKYKEKYSFDEKLSYISQLATKVNKKARVNLVVSGLENLPEGAYFMTPNHQGMFDILAILQVIPGPYQFVYKKEIDDMILVKDVVNMLDFIPIDRQNLRQSVKVIRQVTNELKNGTPVIIFPEGTRSKNGNTLLEFKGGTYKAALNAKVPIVPVSYKNSYKVLDENSLKKVDVYMHIMEPIAYDTYKDMKTNDIAQMVHDIIQEDINRNEG